MAHNQQSADDGNDIFDERHREVFSHSGSEAHADFGSAECSDNGPDSSCDESAR
jgi:hypothetical protein